jgi:hypothetical protein
MDFKTMRNKGTRFYKLYIDDGNGLKFYSDSPSSGKINVNPEKISNVLIRMKDSHGNTSSLSFKLKPNPVEKNVMSLEPLTTDLLYDLTENIMMITARPVKGDTTARFFVKGIPEVLEPAYFNINRWVYLIDLRKKIPDSVQIFGKSILPAIQAIIPPGTEYKFYSDRMDVEFPIGSLYDTLYFNTNHTQSTVGQEVFTIGSRTIPLNKSIHVSLKPLNDYPKDGTYALYRTGNKTHTYIGGEWVNGRLHFSTREFGEFTFLKDSIPPSIRPVYLNNQAVRMKIKDELSGIATFSATLNGEWLLLHYDYKTSLIWSERLDKTKPLKGDFELVVTDNAGNKSSYKQKIP